MKLIKDKKLIDLEDNFTNKFKSYKNKESYDKVILRIKCLIFIEEIKKRDYIKAFEIINTFDDDFLNKITRLNSEYSIDFYNSNNIIEQIDFSTITSLLGYKNPYNCNVSFLLNDCQLDLICEQINSLILEMLNLSKKSVIEIIFQQTILTKNCIDSILQTNGDRLDLNTDD